MDERAALALLADELGPVGDDAAVIDGLVLTTDTLKGSTDFPAGTTRYTAGWRAVGASLSDVAAMGAEPIGAVAAYSAPDFVEDELLGFVRGARDVCREVGTEYVGGDLDESDEFSVTSTAIGRTDDPVLRNGARPGDVVCLTGTFGRTAAALELFDRGDRDRANERFRFEPRIEAGRALAPYATAMMDSSDGLARSLHQLAEASGCGFAVDSSAIPIDEVLVDVSDPERTLELATTVGEDFELVCTIDEADVEAARAATSTPISIVGTAVDDGITMDGEPLEDRGYTHG